MLEEEQERLAVVTDGITLEPVTLILVRDTELDPASSLKAKCLFVNAEPHLCCVFVELVKETLHLPQRILCHLLLGVFTKVEHTNETSEVLPLSDASDGLPSSRELPVHCTCNKVIPEDWVTLKPHGHPWSGQEAIHEQEPDHLVDLSQIKGFIAIVDGATKTSTLCCSSCIVGCVDDSLLDELR
jgi:hypothetical protein